MTLGRFDLEFTDEARTKLAAVAWDGTKLGSDYVSFGTVTVGKAPYRLRPTNSPNKKGGFRTAEQNAQIEKAAIKAVRTRLVSEGWVVRSVEVEKVGYDLECTRGEICLHVEVKGIRATGVSFMLTARERKCAAADPNFELFAVTRALSKPVIHRYKGSQIERDFDFSTLQWRLDKR